MCASPGCLWQVAVVSCHIISTIMQILNIKYLLLHIPLVVEELSIENSEYLIELSNACVFLHCCTNWMVKEFTREKLREFNVDAGLLSMAWPRTRTVAAHIRHQWR